MAVLTSDHFDALKGSRFGLSAARLSAGKMQLRRIRGEEADVASTERGLFLSAALCSGSPDLLRQTFEQQGDLRHVMKGATGKKQTRNRGRVDGRE